MSNPIFPTEQRLCYRIQRILKKSCVKKTLKKNFKKKDKLLSQFAKKPHSMFSDRLLQARKTVPKICRLKNVFNQVKEMFWLIGAYNGHLTFQHHSLSLIKLLARITASSIFSPLIYNNGMSCHVMTVSDLLQQPCDNSDNINKVVIHC